jgi:hypothetical protein
MVVVIQPVEAEITCGLAATDVLVVIDEIHVARATEDIGDLKLSMDSGFDSLTGSYVVVELSSNWWIEL